MSLQVWLPFTSDLHNQGVSGLIPVQTTAPTWVDGKLGKAMSTGALYLPANDVAKFYNNNAMSFAFWIYAVGSSGSSVILGQSNMSVGNNRMFTIFQYPSPNDLHLSWQSNESSTTFLGGVLYDVFPSGTWTHCAITYDGAKATVYINGVYQTSWNGVSTRTNFTYDVPIPSTSIRYLNDFRIYDHALSAKEVKELSKGLVAHYTLGDAYLEGTTNLITSLTQGGQTAISGNSVTTSGLNKDTYFTINLSESIVSGTQYTISCYAEGIPDGSTWTFPLGAQGNTSLSWVIHNGYNAYTFTANSIDWGTNRLFMDDTARTFYGITKFSNFQLEKKDHATGYAGMGGTRNDTTVYDCSGYNYHGTKTGDLTVSSDTSRYSLSTHFNGTSYSYLTSPSAEVKTISFWAKWDSIPSGQSILFVDYKSRLGFGLMSKGILCGSVTGTYYTFSKSSIVANTWYHFVVINPDNSTRKLYINGVEQTATTSMDVWSYNIDQLQIGKRSTSSDGFVGNMSDFRIYATALSADDVQQLYNAPVSVSNTGSLLTQGEFMEVG